MYAAACSVFLTVAAGLQSKGVPRGMSTKQKVNLVAPLGIRNRICHFLSSSLLQPSQRHKAGFVP